MPPQDANPTPSFGGFGLKWDGDRVLEMLTPDFYMTDLDLYVELTTMKQSLVTEKNRKLRLMGQLYPEVNVKLLYRRDFHRILAKYDSLVKTRFEEAPAI